MLILYKLIASLESENPHSKPENHPFHANSVQFILFEKIPRPIKIALQFLQGDSIGD